MHNVIEAAFPWLTVLIVVALVGALLLWLVKPLRGHAIAFGVGLSGLILALFVGAAAGFDFDAAGRVQLAEDYSWIPQIGASVAWGVNGMGLVMVGLAFCSRRPATSEASPRTGPPGTSAGCLRSKP